MSAISERWALSREASTSGYSHITHKAAPARDALKKYTFGQNCRNERSFGGNSRASKGLACRAHEIDEEPLPYLDRDYHPQRNAEYWSLRPVTVLKRSLEIGIAFSGWLIEVWLRKDSSSISMAQAERLREVLTDLGPAFVKIGQAVSSRPDFVPPSYTRELEKLQDRIPPFSDSEALNIIQEELGLPASLVYSDFSPKSIAAASLGQVYKARVRETGRAVAVKVQRPGVREAIALDVFIMRFLVGRFGAWRRLNSDLASLLDEWAGSLFRELDYRREAANGTKFRQLYSHLEGVYVPEMIHELTTERVLTMEWLDGVRLRSAGDDPSKGQALNLEDMKLVEYGVQCSLEQMLEDGFYHADPHPGNLLRTDDGRLGYLDFGMMASIEPHIRRALIRATLHMVNREFQALANDFETLGLLPSGSDKDKVVPALTGVFEKALAGGVSNISFGTLSAELGMTMYDFKFRIPPYYTLLVRSLSVLEGIALSSDPNYKVLGAAYPWVARRLLTDASPELRETLRLLLYKGNRFQFSRLETLLRQALRSPSRVYRGLPPQQPSLRSSNKPLDFVLGSEGRYVRELITEELAKGIDAAWRLSTDNFLQNARARLTSMLQGNGWWGNQAAVTKDPALLMALLSTLNTFPDLADETDSYQVEGIMRLVEVLQEVNDSNKTPDAGAAPSGAVPQGQVEEATRMLRWFVVEAQTLSPAARIEALRLPLTVGAKLSSRVAARALKAVFSTTSGANGKVQPGSTAGSWVQRPAAAPSTRLVNGTLQPAKPPPAQPAVGLGGEAVQGRLDADIVVSIPPGEGAVTGGLSKQGGGSMQPSNQGTKREGPVPLESPNSIGSGSNGTGGFVGSSAPESVSGQGVNGYVPRPRVSGPVPPRRKTDSVPVAANGGSALAAVGAGNMQAPVPQPVSEVGMSGCAVRERVGVPVPPRQTLEADAAVEQNGANGNSNGRVIGRPSRVSSSRGWAPQNGASSGNGRRAAVEGQSIVRRSYDSAQSK